MKYHPCIKSKVGHLDALGSEMTSYVCPLVDLSKVGNDRLASKFGDVIASASAVASKLGDQKYYIDLDSNESSRVLSYEYLIRQKDGYKNWVTFLKDNFGKNCSPILQFSPKDDPLDLFKQIDVLVKHYGDIGIRVPFWIKEKHLRSLKTALKKSEVADKITFFVEIGQLNADLFNFYKKTNDWSELNDFQAINIIDDMCGDETRPKVVFLSNSFPSSIVVDVNDEVEGVGLSDGTRPLIDWTLWRYLRQRFGNMAEIEYGDYATINQESGRGRGWIPRVDIPFTDEFIFTRQRTKSNMNQSLSNAGLKENALPSNNADALKVICRRILDNREIAFASNRVKSIVEATSQGKPPRADPGFWTTVRMSEHIANVGSMIELEDM